jgi:hypothetical protein
VWYLRGEECVNARVHTLLLTGRVLCMAHTGCGSVFFSGGCV